MTDYADGLTGVTVWSVSRPNYRTLSCAFLSDYELAVCSARLSVNISMSGNASARGSNNSDVGRGSNSLSGVFKGGEGRKSGSMILNEHNTNNTNNNNNRGSTNSLPPNSSGITNSNTDSATATDETSSKPPNNLTVDVDFPSLSLNTPSINTSNSTTTTNNPTENASHIPISTANSENNNRYSDAMLHIETSRLSSRLSNGPPSSRLSSGPLRSPNQKADVVIEIFDLRKETRIAELICDESTGACPIHTQQAHSSMGAPVMIHALPGYRKLLIHELSRNRLKCWDGDQLSAAHINDWRALRTIVPSVQSDDRPSSNVRTPPVTSTQTHSPTLTNRVQSTPADATRNNPSALPPSPRSALSAPELFSCRCENVTVLQFQPMHNGRVAFACEDGKIQVWDCLKAKPLLIVKQQSSVKLNYDLVLSLLNGTLVSVCHTKSMSYKLCIYNEQSGALLKVCSMDRIAPRSIAVIDSDTLAVYSYLEKKIGIYSLASSRFLRFLSSVYDCDVPPTPWHSFVVDLCFLPAYPRFLHVVASGRSSIECLAISSENTPRDTHDDCAMRVAIFLSADVIRMSRSHFGKLVLWNDTPLNTDDVAVQELRVIS